MANVLVNELSLTAIGEAIREKNGETTKYKPGEMAAAIVSLPTGGGGGGEVEPIVLTGNQLYGCAGAVAGSYIKLFGDTISTNNITNARSMFNGNTSITEIPFEINLNNATMDNMFNGCTNLEHIPDMDCKHTSYQDISSIFYGCRKLKDAPYLYNAYPTSLSQIFGDCRSIREIPEDYFDTWNYDRVNSYQYSSDTNCFNGCYSLRKMPKGIFEKYNLTVAKPYYYSIYTGLFNTCASLDEITDLMVFGEYSGSNVFSSTFTGLNRVKRITFATDNGVPKTAKWKGQTISLNYLIGYINSPTLILDFNSGITADKRVIDKTTYQALKNDPDWFTASEAYSRYNRASAVETINSLPDTSAYGTNTIKFNGKSGEATDEGAINTLTEEEIAVAAAKGWTVSFV